jgi:flagellar basal body rod protein FlgG
MISGIYPYLVAGGAQSLKKFENSFRNLADLNPASTKTGAQGGGGIQANAAGPEEGIKVSATGAVTQGSSGLFVDVSGINPGQDIPRMIVLQRGYEASLKAFQAESEIIGHTLDIVA